MENIKTLWQLFQEIIENDGDRRYSIHEFLLYSNEEDRKRVENELANKDAEQMQAYLWWFNFVNKKEVYLAACEYIEHVNQRPLCMWEMWDIWDAVEDYISENLPNLPEED